MAYELHDHITYDQQGKDIDYHDNLSKIVEEFVIQNTIFTVPSIRLEAVEVRSTKSGKSKFSVEEAKKYFLINFGYRLKKINFRFKRKK